MVDFCTMSGRLCQEQIRVRSVEVLYYTYSKGRTASRCHSCYDRDMIGSGNDRVVDSVAGALLQ